LNECNNLGVCDGEISLNIIFCYSVPLLFILSNNSLFDISISVTSIMAEGEEAVVGFSNGVIIKYAKNKIWMMDV
jgi:hypothetical protein